MDIETAYLEACGRPSDLNEHLPLLHQYALSCQHITEFGVRLGISTVCFIHAHPLRIVSYDVDKKPDVARYLQELAESASVQFSFHAEDVRNTRIEATELLFIDTWHVYDQLRLELIIHADRVNKFIALHDTVTFGDVGESPGHRGLWPALIEFLQIHPEWTIFENRSNNNGLTILRRKARHTRG
jgi:predicted O-methyltransferase YrrM